MSLATRCIHCGTIFKIVEDQLKVSQGWVRCGRCHEVFNALPTLFDMDREPPPPRPASAPRPDELVSAASSVTPAQHPSWVTLPPQVQPTRPLTEHEPPLEPSRTFQAATDFELDTHVSAEDLNTSTSAPPDESPGWADEPARIIRTNPLEAAGGTPTPAEPPPPLAPPMPLPEAQLPSTDEADALDSRYLMPSDRERVIAQRRQHGPEFADAEFPFDAMLDARAEDPRTHHLAQPDIKPASGQKAPSHDTPAFIRQAQRQAFWRQPSIRGLLTGLILALLLSLGLQVMHHFRDHLAAQHFAWRNWLTQWCGVAHCTLEPPLRINDLQVESANLVRAESDGTHRYRLTVTIRNRADVALAWPHVDLTLTNTSGAVIARRSLPPEDAKWSNGNVSVGTFAKRPIAAPPLSSTTLTWHLRAPSLQPAGYTAELFYP